MSGSQPWFTLAVSVVAMSACSPSGTPSIPSYEWETHWRLASFSQDEASAFVVEQSYERNQVISVAYGRAEFRVHEVSLPDGQDSELIPATLRGTAWHMYPRDEAGHLLIDGVQVFRERTRMLWRVDLDGHIETLESLPQDIWDPPQGGWSYLPSPDGNQIARIFRRGQFVPTPDQDYVEPLTGLSVPLGGVVVTTLDAMSGGEVLPPVVAVSPTFTPGGVPTLQPRWTTEGDLVLTDGVDTSFRIEAGGSLSSIDTPSCLGDPTPGRISSAGEVMTVDYRGGQVSLVDSDDIPFGCP